MFRSSDVKAESVQISQSLHQGKNSNLSFSLGIREPGPSPGPFSFANARSQTIDKQFDLQAGKILLSAIFIASLSNPCFSALRKAS